MRATPAGPPRIVFYGSLMEGQALPGRPDPVALGARRLGPCRVYAELWDTGLGYPALLHAGDSAAGEVAGELWELDDPAPALSALDAFEGVRDGDPGASEYLRVAVRCVEPAGVEAWIYLWNRPVAGMARIPDGDWRAWTSRSGRGA